MKIYYEENINPIFDYNEKEFLKTHNECNSISKEIFDNEYLVLNLLVKLDADEKINNSINIDFSVDELASNLDSNNLPGDVKIFTIFNSDIVTSSGKIKKLPLYINQDDLLPLYIGIDTSYLGNKSNIIITIENKNINISLKKNGHMLHNKGTDEMNTLSRLMWLNSNLYNNSKKSYIYNDIEEKDGLINFLGKTVKLSSDGFIENVFSYINDRLNIADECQAELLDGGIKFIINDNVNFNNYKIEKVGSNLNIHSRGIGDNVEVENFCRVKYTGVFEYEIKVTAKNDTVIEVDEVNSFSKYASKYMNGLGKRGEKFSPFNFKWNGNSNNSIFIGNINVGANISWESEAPSLEQNIPTTTWDNHGEGGIDILFEKERAKVSAYSGKYKLTAGESHIFKFTVALTPFRNLDLFNHFSNRTYQSNRQNITAKNIISHTEKENLNKITIGNNNKIYSAINYPFGSIENIKNIVETAHHDRVAVNLSYNLNDIDIRCPEIHAITNAKDNILLNHDVTSKIISDRYKIYSERYHQPLNLENTEKIGCANCAIPLNEKSRFNNYYVETVNWLVKECGINGIEMRDDNMDSETIERVRKVIDRYRGNIELTIDYKNNTTYSINNTVPLLPYADSILVNHAGNIKSYSPENILLEMSGINYGISGDIIDIDVFLGMLYGMTNRAGYNEAKNTKLYKLLDKFHIEDSEMVGFWAHDALKASDEGVKITYYKNDKKVLICMYNFNNYPAMFTVDYSPLKIKGIMKSYPMSKLIINQKFQEKTSVVLYNKCGVFILGDIE